MSGGGQARWLFGVLMGIATGFILAVAHNAVAYDSVGTISSAAGGTGLNTSSSSGLPSISSGTWSVSATSAGLRTVISDETGTGSLMFGLSTDMTDGLTCGASQVVRRNSGDTAFECGTITAGVDTPGTPANNQLAIFTDADTIEGDANLTWDAATLAIVSGTLAGNDESVTITATQAATPVGTQNAIDIQITGAGTDADANRALFLNYAAGYTGAASAASAAISNRTVGTGDGAGCSNFGNQTGVGGNVALCLSSGGTNASGWNVGGTSEAFSSTDTNVGFASVAAANGAGSHGVGLIAQGPDQTGAAGNGIGLLALLGNLGNIYPSNFAAGTDAAIVASNASVATPIQMWFDNTTEVARLADDGEWSFFGAGSAVLAITRTANFAGSAYETRPLVRIDSAADTAIATTTEVPLFLGNFDNATRTWAAGTVVRQADFRIDAPTYGGSAATATFTDAASLAITSASILGSNAAFTATSTVLLGTAAVGGATDSYVIKAFQNTGATNDGGILLSSAETGTGLTGSTRLRLSNTSTGDLQIEFDTADTGAATWTMGLDNSDSDNFSLSSGNVLGTTPAFTVAATGLDVTIANDLTVSGSDTRAGCTLNGAATATCTDTVISGARCTCDDSQPSTNGVGAMAVEVSGTTLTVTSNVTLDTSIVTCICL